VAGGRCTRRRFVRNGLPAGLKGAARSSRMSNLYRMIQQYQDDGTPSASARMYGVEVAIVTNNKDDKKLGRVKVMFPRLPNNPESDWIRVASLIAGPERGFYWIPEVKDEVLVAFERGESSRAYVIGCLWSGKDKPPKDGPHADNDVRHICTRSGHKITMIDTKDAEKIIIADKSGKRTVTWDVKAKKWKLEANEGDVEILVPNGKVKIDCKEWEVKVKEAAKIDVGKTLDVKSGQASNYQAGPSLNIKASRVNIN
jgi:uncharacterized protein involved in type VI secretion and phage assembly